ncbi:MAG: RNB domain-containing ribonuclease, partial [Rhodoferax sp.]|nr:RNB domain-containing ribonuclease [Rhodoferax sp.]
VQGLGSGRVTVGIHIAAPALAVQPGSPVDRLGRERLSTVYTPGHKVTMLPDAVVQRYTLLEGRDCPAVSLYVALDEATLEVVGHETRLERVPIQSNLRHDQLDAVVTERWLQDPDFTHENEPQALLGKRPLLSFLYRLAQHLKAAREQIRGKPETFSRPDYTFRLTGDASGEPQGDEPVQITTRSRGAPLDLIVAEAMILANSHWGGWMAELGVPAIYRSQASLLPGVKVRMGTKPLPHAGIGVRSYAWSTSPLRRYVDLVNQWQIIACARHGRTAALAAPFKARDTDLYAIVSAFDAAHAAYNACQATLERYWTLKFLQQQQTTELTATLIKDGLARCDSLPLVLPVAGAGGLPRGARLLLRLGAIDLITLDVAAALVSRLDTGEGVAAAPETPDADEDEDATAGPIAIALDLGDHDAASPAGEPAPT